MDAARIFTFFQVADRVIQLCRTYLELARDAPSDLRAILIETSTLRTILDNLQFLESCSHSSTALHATVGKEGPIAGCLRVIKEIEGLFPREDTTLTQPGLASTRRKVQATLTSLAWPFKESKARKLLGELVQFKTTINLAISTESLHDTKSIKDKSNQIHATLSEFQSQEVYRWLRSTDPSSLHHQACQKYQPGTSDWIFRSNEWEDWFEERHRCVWIHGIPGAGKTVLASHLIKRVKTLCNRDSLATRKVASLYYYCYFGHNQNEAIPFLKWTVGQLCRKAELVPPSLYQLYKECSEPSLADLLEVFEAIAQVYDRIYIIMDAVDESMPRHDLLRVLRDLATDSRFHNISILATSRRYIDVEETMLKVSAPVSMTNPLLDADIKLYVESRLHGHSRMSHWPAEIQHEVVEALSSKANGMFRWVVCQLDILQHLNPDRAIIRNALADLPETLDETYERIFLGIPQYARAFVHGILKSIHSHLKLISGNISIPILLQISQRSSPQFSICNNEFADGVELLQKFCGCLISITWHGRFGREHTVSFAHYTVWEFIKSPRIHNSPAKFFAVDTESTELEFARMLMHGALKVESHEFLDLDNLNDASVGRFKDLDNDFNLYLIVCSMFCLSAWGSRICQRDDLRLLAFNLLDPLMPHFNGLENAGRLVSKKKWLLGGREYDAHFWEVHWRAKPELSEARTFLNLLYSDRSFELGRAFLKNRNTEGILQTQLDIRLSSHIYERGWNGFLFQGPLRELPETIINWGVDFESFSQKDRMICLFNSTLRFMDGLEALIKHCLND